jgi:hypothetical protein
MNISVPISAGQPAGVSIFRDERGLQCFRDPACAAALWDRTLPAEVTTWLAALDPAKLPDGRVIVQRYEVRQTVAQLCEIAQMPEEPQRAWLIDEIDMLAQRFAHLMNAPYLRMRLQTVTTNSCRRFHLDAITGRLVCTYRGTGTQYGISVNGEDPEQVFTTPTGTPILLRGSLWPTKTETGLLHRSPPIEGTGEIRLVLVLDPIFDLEEAE